MQIDKSGTITWATTAKSPRENIILIKVIDQAQAEWMQEFTINVVGGSNDASSDLETVVTSNEPLQTLLPVAANFATETLDLELPGTIKKVTLGANGRLMFLHMPESKLIAIVDLSQGKIKKMLSIPEPQSFIIGGAQHGLLFHPTAKKVQRYRLDNLTCDAQADLSYAGKVESAYLGINSTGIAFLRIKDKEDQNTYDCTFDFFDTQSLKSVPIAWPNPIARDFRQIERRSFVLAIMAIRFLSISSA